MVAEVLRLGPFIKGLNKASDPVTVENEELVQCLNMELDIDGSLINRPAIQVTEEGSSDDRILIFGHAHFDGTDYIFATRSGLTFVSSDLGATWSELNPDSNSRECKCMVIYQNRVWMPATPGSANGGISWSVAGGARAEDAMPRGSATVAHKNRMYICPGEDATSDSSTLHFSAPADFTDWPGTNFINVQEGDGSSLNNIVVYQDNLMLFKGESTHVLAYDLDPIDAILREINPVVGSHGSFGIVQHENTVYCMYHELIYEIINFRFGLLNIKVPFEFNDTLPPGTSARHENEHLTLLGDRLIARFYNRTYVFNLRTRTWSEWRKTDNANDVEWHVFGPLVRIHTLHDTSGDAYISSYSFTMNDSSGYKVIKIVDAFTVSDTEGFGSSDMECIITTKDFDFADPVRYKRLFWWGADLLTGNDIVADVKPITLLFSPTWDQLNTMTWSELNTWGSPVDEPLSTETIVLGDSIFTTNKMIKFNKSLRFRKINFSVKLLTTGSISEPAKIFSLIALVRTKQIVSAQVS